MGDADGIGDVDYERVAGSVVGPQSRSVCDPGQQQAYDKMVQLLQDVKHLDDENALSDESCILRFLRARKFNPEKGAEMLRATLIWRRENRPWEWNCKWCLAAPGYHTWRQIGSDKFGRPVVYSCFEQAGHYGYTAEDSVCHMVFAIESAIRTMPKGVEQWVWVNDFSGFSIQACSPKLASACGGVCGNHYPERLGLFLAINPPQAFVIAWSALSKVIDPVTASKMMFVRGQKVEEALSKFFPADLAQWLREEIDANKQRPLPEHQSRSGFWRPPPLGVPHDPRGSPSYLSKYCSANASTGHSPHPNIQQCLRTEVASPTKQPEVFST